MAIIIQPTSIGSAESFGTPTLYVQVKTDFESSLESDLENVFYNTEEFAKTITYTFVNGTQQQLDVIFDEETEAIDMTTGAPVITSEPQFHCASHDFNTAPDKGDSCLIGNKIYYVMEALPNGAGVTVVTLRRS